MIRGMSEFDLSPLLADLSVPTRVCHAEGDRVAHVAEGRTLAQLKPEATFKQWNNPNHPWRFEPSWRDHINDLIEFSHAAARKPLLSRVLRPFYSLELWTRRASRLSFVTKNGALFWIDTLQLAKRELMRMEATLLRIPVIGYSLQFRHRLL